MSGDEVGGSSPPAITGMDSATSIAASAAARPASAAGRRVRAATTSARASPGRSQTSPPALRTAASPAATTATGISARNPNRSAQSRPTRTAPAAISAAATTSLIPPQRKYPNRSAGWAAMKTAAARRRGDSTSGAGERPEPERENRGQPRHVRLDQPGDVGADDRPSDAERQEGADRVSVGEVERQRRLVARRCQAVEVAPMLHHPVGQRHPGRRVVEPDVAGERRLAGEDDRRRVDGVGAGRGEQRPAARPAAAGAARRPRARRSRSRPPPGR